jgi:hypothetical protein
VDDRAGPRDTTGIVEAEPRLDTQRAGIGIVVEQELVEEETVIIVSHPASPRFDRWLGSSCSSRDGSWKWSAEAAR